MYNVNMIGVDRDSADKTRMITFILISMVNIGQQNLV